MAAERVERIYEQHIKLLSVQERLELLALVAEGLVAQPGVGYAQGRRSILDLHGLGKEIWQGLDAQEYIRKLRDEWERSA
jgi:hypothetical protein